MIWQTTATVLKNLRDFENRDAWDSFAERFRQPIVSFARSMGLHPSDAEDVAQETLLAFAQAFRGGQYDPAKGRLSRFLFGIAYRQALRARRLAGAGGARGVNCDDEPLRVAPAHTTFWAQLPDEQAASGIWDTEWEQAVLERCMQQARVEFEPQTFRAFELTVRDGRSPTEAAETLGVAVKSVYNAKHRVLKRIRQLRQEYDDDAHGSEHDNERVQT